MLVLCRKLDEDIIIPGIGLTIKLVEVQKNGIVRLGFKGPRNVEVVRRELCVNHRDQNRFLKADELQNKVEEAAEAMITARNHIIAGNKTEAIGVIDKMIMALSK
jgi:carbon storage regulator CsrA